MEGYYCTCNQGCHKGGGGSLDFYFLLNINFIQKWLLKKYVANYCKLSLVLRPCLPATVGSSRTVWYASQLSQIGSREIYPWA